MWFKSNAHFTNHDWPHRCSAKPCLCFVFQYQDNVKLYKQAKFDENIQCSSRVMSIFTKRAQPTKMMLGEASLEFCIPATGQCKNIFVYTI